jgi:hypothetical protein
MLDNLFEEGKLNPIVEELYILYLKLRGGYWRVRDAFSIWGFMMTHSLERLNERCHGLNCFDEFYSTLNGGWKK